MRVAGDGGRGGRGGRQGSGESKSKYVWVFEVDEYIVFARPRLHVCKPCLGIEGLPGTVALFCRIMF